MNHIGRFVQYGVLRNTSSYTSKRATLLSRTPTSWYAPISVPVAHFSTSPPPKGGEDGNTAPGPQDLGLNEDGNIQDLDIGELPSSKFEDVKTGDTFGSFKVTDAQIMSEGIAPDGLPKWGSEVSDEEVKTALGYDPEAAKARTLPKDTPQEVKDAFLQAAREHQVKQEHSSLDVRNVGRTFDAYHGSVVLKIQFEGRPKFEVTNHPMAVKNADGTYQDVPLNFPEKIPKPLQTLKKENPEAYHRARQEYGPIARKFVKDFDDLEEFHPSVADSICRNEGRINWADFNSGYIDHDLKEWSGDEDDVRKVRAYLEVNVGPLFGPQDREALDTFARIVGPRLNPDSMKLRMGCDHFYDSFANRDRVIQQFKEIMLEVFPKDVIRSKIMALNALKTPEQLKREMEVGKEALEMMNGPLRAPKYAKSKKDVEDEFYAKQKKLVKKITSMSKGTVFEEWPYPTKRTNPLAQKHLRLMNLDLLKKIPMKPIDDDEDEIDEMDEDTEMTPEELEAFMNQKAEEGAKKRDQMLREHEAQMQKENQVEKGNEEGIEELLKGK